MTDKATLLALADRVEALTGPCRETDKAILHALGYSWRGMAYWYRDDSHEWKGGTFFTGSLDAAMALVPKGHDYSLERVNDEYWASVCSKSHRTPILNAATPALALCAAALRALANGGKP